MSSGQPRRAGELGVLARAALGLYPPAWRARYGDEVLALLEDSGAGVGAAVSLAWHAVPAWACPPRHLYDRRERMRASLATVGIAWALLAGLGAVFAQLAQAQGQVQGPTLPALALRRLRPHGPVLVLAARAAFLAAVTMGLAGAASVVAAVGLYLWAPAYAGYHVTWPLAVYLPAVLLTSAVAVVSATRGIRAADPPAVA
jgi:hypothetical protein